MPGFFISQDRFPSKISRSRFKPLSGSLRTFAGLMTNSSPITKLLCGPRQMPSLARRSCIKKEMGRRTQHQGQH